MFESPQNYHVEALTLNVMVFGEWDLWEIGLHEVRKAGPWSDRISALLKKKHQRACFLSLHLLVPRKGRVRAQQEGGHLQHKERTLTRHQPCWQFDPVYSLQNSEK